MKILLACTFPQKWTLACLDIMQVLSESSLRGLCQVKLLLLFNSYCNSPSIYHKIVKHLWL